MRAKLLFIFIYHLRSGIYVNFKAVGIYDSGTEMSQNVTNTVAGSDIMTHFMRKMGSIFQSVLGVVCFVEKSALGQSTYVFP